MDRLRYPVETLHRRGASSARAPLHEPRPAGLRPGQPAGDGQGRAVRPLLALSGHPAPPLPGGVRGREGTERRAGLRRRRGRARGGPLRAGLHRLRRRLDRPGRRRPRRLRVGLQRAHQDPSARPARRLPRAVDPLHPLRPADRGDRRLPLLLRRRARARVRARRWTSCSRSTRAASRRPRCGRPSAGRATPSSPRAPGSGSIRAKALDLLRGLLPASTLSHVGIYASGQAYEGLLLRLAASPLPEARAFGEMLLAELEQVIPSFVARVERPDRGGDWVEHLRERREATERAVARLGLDRREGDDMPSVELVHVDGTEEDLLCASLYESAGVAEDRDPPPDRRAGPDRARGADRRAGRRAAQPPPPPRPRLGGGALPLRDRLRLRRLSRPPAPPDAHLPVAAPRPRARRRRPRRGPRGRRRRRVRARARDLAAPSSSASRPPGLAEAAPYALCLGYRIRYVLDLNAREAMHLCELRSGREGHPTYRAVAQAMHERIAAVHPAIARGDEPRRLDHRAAPRADPERDPHPPQARRRRGRRTAGDQHAAA